MWEEGSLSKTVTTGGELPIGFTCFICDEVQPVPDPRWIPVVNICDNCKRDLKELVLHLREEDKSKDDYLNFNHDSNV